MAADAAPRFVSLIADLVAHGFHGYVNCAASGHMPRSLHHSGRACDFAQLARNHVAAGAGIMYHAHDIIARHGLRDGCSFHDCGHVDTGTPIPVGYRHHERRYLYAHLHERQHYAWRYQYRNDQTYLPHHFARRVVREAQRTPIWPRGV